MSYPVGMITSEMPTLRPDMHMLLGQYDIICWRDYGKPRQGPVCELMRTTRLRFKYTLRQCQVMEESSRADAIAKSYSSKDMASFWKSVKKMHNKSVPLATTIHGVTGTENISEMWRGHYSDILTSVDNVSCKDRVQSTLDSISSADKLVITPLDIAEAIKYLKSGKAVGYDLLAAEHFIHSDETVFVLLSLLYTAFITHGFLPDSIMRSIIIPLIKNKTGNIGDKNNYIPIALVTAASKILEIVILNLIESYIETSHHQFGFKSKHSTDLCIYSLKNIVQYYKYHNSPVFACFLDASRAFDRVNFWSLFNKLIARGVPLLLVRLLCFWYNTQQFCIKWDNSTSAFFKSSNGVRQGGILSPRLFSLYVDDLSLLLCKQNIGCFIDNVCVNHLFYADDICLLAPSAAGIQQLINICEKYGIEHDILFNSVKSKCMSILPSRYHLNIPTVTLNNAPLVYTDSIKYLGVVISHTFKDDNDIVRQLRFLYASANAIIRKFSRCTIPVKLQLLESYCLNFYCSTVWCNYTKQCMSKLRVAYNNIYRNILGFKRHDSASAMFVNNHIDTFEARFRKTCYIFRQRLYSCKNNIVMCINNNSWVHHHYMWNTWNSLIYKHYIT